MWEKTAVETWELGIDSGFHLLGFWDLVEFSGRPTELGRVFSAAFTGLLAVQESIT